MARFAPATSRYIARALIALAWSCSAAYAQHEALVPLPSHLYSAETDTTNPVLDLRDKTLAATSSLAAEIPDSLSVENNGGAISYDNEARTVTYDGNGTPVTLRTDDDTTMQAQRLSADLQKGIATLAGPMSIYRGDVLVRCEEGGTYDMNNKVARMGGLRAKVGGIIIRGSGIEYHTDAAGKPYIVIYDAYVSTEDVEKPSVWVGTGTLTIYPGDYGSVSRLSIAGEEKEMTVPLLGWVQFSHSLNPREGYMPNFGGKSAWGTYLLNSYGFLLGNKRVEHGMPTADYLVTTHLDFRSRRGAAVGLDAEDIALAKRYKEMTGLKAYGLADSDPMINPVESERLSTRHNRYRVALQTEFDATPAGDTKGKWKLATNINAVSDRYALRDFFETMARVDAKPDNTVRLTRTDKDSEAMLMTRFSPNNYYTTDERAQVSYYRVRKTLGNTRIAYETNNSAAIMRQALSAEERIRYQDYLAVTHDGELKDYYTRLLNTQSYARVNTTHELTTGFKLLPFLNITPKTGGGYTGYYDVGGIGSDNRFMGYIGCDFDMKFHRRYERFSYSRFGLRGLTHVIHPYVSFSQATISSSNEQVPKVDYWSSTMGTSTLAPMPLDFCGFTGIDGWGQWTIMRIGVHNVLNSSVEQERIRLVDWNVFIDCNVDNPNTDSRYSDLYSFLSFTPSERLRFSLDSQTPTIRNGYGFYQYNASVTYMPFSWLEGRAGFRSIQDHPVLEDADQLYLQSILRLDERYTFSGRWYFDMNENRIPIQEYSVFRNCGAWYLGATLFLRDNGGKKEEGLGFSFTLGETGTALPIKFL